MISLVVLSERLVSHSIVRDVDKICNRRELSLHRRVYQDPFLKTFNTGEGFSAGKIATRSLSTSLIVVLQSF